MAAAKFAVLAIAFIALFAAWFVADHVYMIPVSEFVGLFLLVVMFSTPLIIAIGMALIAIVYAATGWQPPGCHLTFRSRDDG